MVISMASQEQFQINEVSQRIEYHPPQLKQWGSVADLTEQRNDQPLPDLEPGSVTPELR